jgi:PAS domain S-box-containing protein
MDRSLAPSPDFILTPEALPFPGAPPAPAERGDRIDNLSLFPELEPLFGDEGPFQLQAGQVLESMSDGFVFLDREWRYRYINGRADEFHLRHGRTHGQLIGRTVWECYPAAEESELGGCLRAAAATRRVAECVVHEPVTGAWQECRIVPGPGGTAVYLRDVTERKRVEAEQALLAAAGQALAGSLDPRELLKRAAELPLPLLGRWCFAYLLEDDGSVKALEAACLVPEKVETYRELVRRFPGAASHTHPFVQAVRGGRTVLVPEVTDETFAALSDDEEFRALARKMAPVSLLCVPLVARGRTLGALAFATDEPGRRFGARDAALAGELAARVALAFDNARLYRDARLAASRAEEALALLDSLFRGAPIGLAFLDPELRYVAINDALARTNGLAAEAHLGRTVDEAIPACARIVEPQLRRVLETGEPVVDWEWSAEVPGHPGEVRHWLESFYPVVGDEGRVLGVGVALAEITAIKRAEDVQRFLAEASRLVAPALDRQGWLEQLPRSALPRLGDYCVIDLAGDDGGVRASVAAHVDPEKEEVARELRRFPLKGREGGSPVMRVLRSGEPEVVLDVPSGFVADTVDDEERRALLRRIAPNSYLVLPLEARGRRLGVMSFVMSEPGRRHTPGDVALAEELVRRVALAIDNARLYEAERAAAARMSRLFAMTAALSGAVTPAEVAAAVVTHGMRDLGARQGMLALPTADGAALELVGPRGVPAEVARRWGTFALDAPVPLADAFRAGRPVLIETVAEYAARYPGLSDTSRDLENRACAVLPLEVDGRVLGSLAFTFEHERAFTAADRGFLETVARQCAQALERARLYEAERAPAREAEAPTAPRATSWPP